jgi:predicted HicB family RNase H-like nuclease
MDAKEGAEMSDMLMQAAPAAPFVPEEASPVEPVLQIPVNLNGNRPVEALRYAEIWYGRKPDWVTFFREVLGVGGVVRRLFTTPEQLATFEKSEQYAEIQQMVAKLREQPAPPADDKEPTRVITVRMPKSLHESLREEAQDKRTSMNQLCISKLLQVIDNELIPTE